MVSVLNHKSAQLAEYGSNFLFTYGKNTDICMLQLHAVLKCVNMCLLPW